jgi:uncharacterized protein YhhL (DUF1145 family)
LFRFLKLVNILEILVNDACHEKNGKKHWLEILANFLFSVQNFAHMKKKRKEVIPCFLGKEIAKKIYYL